MKQLISLLSIVTLLGGLLLPVLLPTGAANPLIPAAQAQGPVGEGEPETGGMPGYPQPAKPIPHHEPGHLSKAGSYRTQAEQENELGALETVQISGVDAMVADGLDPLGGNYTLVNWDNIMFGSLLNNSLNLQSFKYTSEPFPNLELIPGSQSWQGNYPVKSISAGDLNGDGQAEQIAVWIDEENRILWTIGELYGNATSAPAAFAHGDGSLSLFVRGYDDALWGRYYDGSSWGGWYDPGGGLLASGPAIASREPGGELQVFVIGADNQVWTRQLGGGLWQKVGEDEGDWPALDQVLPMPELPAPAAVARAGDEFDLFRLGPDNTLRWMRWSDSDGYCDDPSRCKWDNLYGMISSAPGVVSLGPDHMQVFARGVDGALWYRTYNGEGWGTWQRVGLEDKGMPEGITIASAPSAVSPGSGEILVYVRGSDDQAWQIQQHADGSWGTWSSAGGELASGVGAAASNGRIDLFAQAADGNLQVNRYESGSWMGWQDLGWLEQPRYGSLEGKAYHQLDVETGYFKGDGRDQFVLAYRNAADEIVVRLYEVGKSMRPWPLTDPVTTEHKGRFQKLATGDFDGDGTDEIAVAYDGVDDYGIWIEVFDVTHVGGVWGLESKSYMEVDRTEFYTFESTLHITSGDFNGDGDEELAVAADFVHPVPSNDTEYLYAFYVFDVNDAYELVLPAHGHEDKHIFDFQWYNPYLDVGFVLEAGDVDGDGKDEIVRTRPEAFYDNEWAKLWRYLEVVDASPPFKETPEQMEMWDYGLWWNERTELDSLAVGDIDRDLKEEIVFGQASSCPGACYELVVFDFDRSRVDEEINNLYSVNPPTLYGGLSGPQMVTGNFTGESLRVGPPSYRVQNKVDSLEAVINMPPKHRDLVKDGNGGYQRIDVLTEPCADTPNDPRCTHAKHGTRAGTESQLTNTVQRDWTIGTGLDLKIDNGGFFVDASLKYSYGENFSEVHRHIKSTNFSGYATAYEHDKIVYYGTPYAVWEYPVFADNTTIPIDYMTVIFPVVDQSNPQTPAPDTMTGDYPGEPWYYPRHQTYNVWSYDPIGEVRFEDYDANNLILDKTISGGGDWFEVNQSTSDKLVRTTTQTHDFSVEIGRGYKGEAKIPFTAISFGAEYRAHVNGSYKQEDIETDELTTSEQTEFSAFIAEQDTADAFEIRPIAYWSNNGYLVLDYQTEMGDWGTWKAYYDKPDPAFTLPWYGFPDPNEPIPPTSEELKLFSHDMQIDPPFASVGDTVTISATVHNFSNVAPSQPVTVRFYQGDPADGVAIGERTIPNLDRRDGPQTVSITWPASGAVKQKIYAVIDPGDAIDEVHDEGDLIDNNVAYGRIQVGATEYVDMGLASEQAYKRLTYRMGDSLVLSTYVPPGNLSEIVRFELKDADLTIADVLGRPFELLAYLGKRVSDPPETNFSLKPGSHDPPAVITLAYSDADIVGVDENNLRLYRLTGLRWEEQPACDSYQIHRFPEDNFIAVPVCEVGVFVWSDTAPEPQGGLIYLPAIMKGSQ
jgi:hypothetical protein